MLIGCGLRRAELVGLTVEDFQVREEHCVIADLIGKGKHIRTVPVPAWVKRTVDAWTAAAQISAGTIFRPVNRMGKLRGNGLTPKAIWHVVKAAAQRAGIKNLAPHDLRRTCARLCHLAGGNWSKYSSCWATHRFRRPSATWAASRSFVTRSTTTSVWRTPDGRRSRTGLRGRAPRWSQGRGRAILNTTPLCVIER